jgi:uncharacterized protein YggE
MCEPAKDNNANVFDRFNPRRMKKSMRLALFACALWILMVFRAGVGFAQAAPFKPITPKISVNGHSEVKAKPNLMVVSFLIDSKAPTAAECKDLQTTRTQKLVDALKAKLGAAAIETSSDSSLKETYEPVSAEKTPPEKSPAVWTYKATIVAGADDLAILGSLIDAGLAAGASAVEGSGFKFFPVKSPTSSTAKPIARDLNSLSRQSDGFQAGSPTKQMPSVSLEVETHGATADQAIRLGTQITGKVEKALTDKLGDHGEVTMENFGIFQPPAPQSQQINSLPPPPKQKMFNAHTTVTAKTGKFELLGALIEAGMKAGATQLDSASFTLSDEAVSDNAAIAAASKEAETKARTVAKTMTVKLGKLVNVSVNVQVQPQVISGAALQSAIRSAPANSLQDALKPILPRELSVNASVNALYEIH